MAYLYPYGDTQQLNLDWFLNEWKNLLSAWEEEKNGISGALDAEIAKMNAAIENMKNEIDGALDDEIDKAETALSDVFAARDSAAQSATSASADAVSAAQDAASASADAETAHEIAKAFNNARWQKFLPPTIKGINHRGYSITAPENTLPAFKESVRHGFKYVETDIRKTSDGVYVLLHDTSINRTGRNSDGSTIVQTIDITSITYAEALAYDFGIWKGEKFKGTKIPRLIDFLDFCKQTNLYPYMELEMTSLSDADVEPICDLIRKYNLQDVASLICFSKPTLAHIAQYEPSIRIGLLTHASSGYTATDAAELKTPVNSVFLDAQQSFLMDNLNTLVNGCIENRIELECWTPDLITQVINVLPYVSGVTSDIFDASIVAQEKSNFHLPLNNLPDDGIINQFFNIADVYKKGVGNHVTEIYGNKIRYVKENAETPQDYYLISATGKPYHSDATVSQEQYSLICEAAKIPIISASNNLDLTILEEYHASNPSNKMAYSIYLGTVDGNGVATVASKNINPIPNIATRIYNMAPLQEFINAVNANKNLCVFFYSRGGGSEYDELKLTLQGIKGCIIDNSFNAS